MKFDNFENAIRNFNTLFLWTIEINFEFLINSNISN